MFEPRHVYAPAGGSAEGAVARPRLRRLALLLLASLAMLAAGSTAAFAQYPPAEGFSVSCTDASPGATVTCSIVGAVAGESLTVTVMFGSVEVLGVVLTADDEGRATFSFDVPADAAGALLEVRVAGEDSGTIGLDLEVADTVSEAAPVPDDAQPMPRTGQDLLLLGGAGVLLLGAGVVALRRRTASSRERVDA